MLRRVFPILLIVFTNLLGGGVILPILPRFAVGQMGATEQQAALLSTAFFVAQFLASPWLGRLSDRYGRRPVLLVSQLGTVLSFVLFIFAAPLGELLDPSVSFLSVSGGLVMLFIARSLDGFTGGNVTAARAYISDVTSSEDRATGMGYLSAAFGAGFVFGPAFGGLLSKWGLLAPFVGAVVITSITFLLTLFTLEESLPPEARQANEEGEPKRVPFSEVIANRPLFLVMLTGFLGTVAFAGIPPTFALYVDQVVFADLADPAAVTLNIGLMLSFMGVILFLTQGVFYRPLLRRWGELRMVFTGNIVFMFSLFALGLVADPLIITLGMVPFAFGRGISDPTIQALVTRFGDSKVQGQLLGIYQSVFSIAMIFGPVWAGWIYQNIGPGETYVASGFLIIAAVVSSFLLLRQRQLNSASQQA